MSLDAALETFFIEAEELLESMEEVLLKIDEGESTPELLNDIFRSAHTIKGSAGIFGLDHIVEFTHVVENVLDRARDGEIAIDKSLLNVLLKCRDHIHSLVKTDIESYQDDSNLTAQNQSLLDALSPWASTQTTNESSELPSNSTTAPSTKSSSGFWHISLRLSSECLKNGMDPLSFVKFLQTLGEITQIETLTDNFVDFDKFDPEELHFCYEITLKSEADRETIENTFMFVQEDSSIKILSPESEVSDYVKLIEELPEDNLRLGEILVNSRVISQAELEQALAQQESDKSNQKENVPIGEMLIENNIVDSKVVDAALQKQSKATKQSTTGKQIRVDADRLDNLISLIGELVISRQRVDLLANNTKQMALIESVNSLGNFTEQIRDAALSLRMVPIGATLQKFKRIVRDTAQDLDKEIDLIIEGAETELDRLMVEKLTDPLTHIVRNAMDHGIESKDLRKSEGKSETGTLKLSAYQESGHIVIEVSDDGGGINREIIKRKAIDKNIITSESKLSDSEILHLIFHPGFSTAESVTNLSGRGVGMDVVKRNVEALQGNIEIDSKLGLGSTFRMRLPLTLAIIDGFHVESRHTHFIIPQATIIECIDLKSHVDIDNRQCINLRGEMIPYLNLSELFNLDNELSHSPPKQGSHLEKLAIVQFGEERAGIVVDQLNGEIQTVVKPLGPIFQPLKGIGGSTLLGSGEIAFILDIAQLIDVAITRDVDSTKNKLS